MPRVQSAGKFKGKMRYSIYLPEQIVLSIQKDIGKEDIRGTTININNWVVVGYKEPPASKHLRFQGKKDIKEVPAAEEPVEEKVDSPSTQVIP